MLGRLMQAGMLMEVHFARFFLSKLLGKVCPTIHRPLLEKRFDSFFIIK